MTITIHPIRTTADFDAMLVAARSDGHDPLIPPTHLARGPAGQIVGAFNVGHAVCWWLRTDQGVRESIAAFAALETLQRDRGIGRYAILISDDSPYCRVVERTGMRYVEGMRVLTKEI